MNITTPPVSFLPTTAAQPTDVMRRDNQMREIVTQINQNEASQRERGMGSDSERSPQSSNNSYANQLADARAEAGFPRIQERDGQRENGRGSEQQQERTREEENEEPELQELRTRDREVRQHEETHASIGGRYASSPQYEFEMGPDGRPYAVAGQVNIDITPIPGDPQATLQKMQIVRRAAMAPTQPSGADRQVAQEASLRENEARTELRQEQMTEIREVGSAGFSELNSDWAVPQNAVTPAVAPIITRRMEDGSYDGTGVSDGYPGFAEVDALMSARGDRIERFYQGSYRPNESFLLGVA
ncbi:catalase [Aliidiomarina minuta]|uniref:Catalase n=1 Tax=Aliidiomarina minuta TaxID=880057 RepID=A0A432W9C8_9GAMM|nr:putative metalloprotease CJM1_0395 family protein [Aliidiomarina minuta]RUO26757.1 catalase [Aliidiomarina minuta]